MEKLQVILTVVLLLGAGRVVIRKRRLGYKLSFINNLVFFAAAGGLLLYRYRNIGVLSWVLMTASFLYFLIFVQYAVPVCENWKAGRIFWGAIVLISAGIMSLP